MRKGFDPLSTRGSRLNGGRWNPPGTGVLYASLEERTARAELRRAAELAGLPEKAIYPIRLVELEVRCEVVDLTAPDALEAVGIEPPLSTLTEPAQTRAIGAAAEHLGIGAILVGSVAIEGVNAVLFPDAATSGPAVVTERDLRAPGSW